MKRITGRHAFRLAAAVLLLALIIYAFLPDAVRVETAVVERGALQETVEEEGETQLSDRYLITAPVAAFVRRIQLEVGDRVDAGTPVARLEPPRAAILDPRSQAELASRVTAARANLRQAEIAAANAAADLERLERLDAAGAVTRQEVEHTAAQSARAAAARDAARAELSAAQAAQRTTAGAAALGVEDVLRAPAAGRVLAVHRRSEGLVSPGEPLLEVGDTEHLEVVVDVLSQDAVRITAGTAIVLEQWGGEDTLSAVVSRVEPQGFTQVSALGVEERRVRVRAGIASPPEKYARLGPGYRVLARFIVWSEANVLQVPTAALFRHGDGWAVFVVHNGRAVLTPVQIGRRAGLATQITGGIDEGAEVIVHPGNDVGDGVRVSR